MDDFVELMTENPPHEEVVEPQASFGDAIRLVRDVMRADEGLRLAYHLNIVMRLCDTTSLNLHDSNEAASEIMDLLFLNA